MSYKAVFNDNLVCNEELEDILSQNNGLWIVDTIATHHLTNSFINTVQGNSEIKLRHFWKLKVNNDSSCFLTASPERNGEPFLSQYIEYTDFPKQQIHILATANNQNSYDLSHLPLGQPKALPEKSNFWKILGL